MSVRDALESLSIISRNNHLPSKLADESLPPDSRYCAWAAADALRRLRLNATTSDARASFSRRVKRGMAKLQRTPNSVITTTSSTSENPSLRERDG
jgi:hypothetical protein